MIATISNKLSSLKNGWRVLLFLLVVLPLTAFVAVGLRLLKLGQDSGEIQGIWGVVFVIYLVSWAFFRLERRGEPRPWLANVRRHLLLWLAGLALGALVVSLVAGAVWAVGGCHWKISGHSFYVSIIKAFPIWLALAAIEEGIFRGYPFQRTVDGLGFLAAQILFGLLFALVHWHNRGLESVPMRLIATGNLALLAFLFALCWYHTRSLATPIGFHMAWNWIQGSLFGFKVSGTPVSGLFHPVLHARKGWVHGGAFGLEASLPCLAVLGVLLGMVLILDSPSLSPLKRAPRQLS